MAAPAKVANKSPKKPDAPGGVPARREDEEAPPSRLSWFIGWIGAPGLVFGGIFAAGVLVGVHRPDGWITWAVRGFVSLFAG